MKSLHIFKPGCFTTMNGQILEFTEADLEETARSYNPNLHEAPLVIGHPQHDSPAYGWTKELAFTSEGLIARPDQVDPAFAEMIADGRFKKRSAAFYPPDSRKNPVPGIYYLRHIGFLGATSPAVKGLRDIEFSDDYGLLTIEFSDQDLRHSDSFDNFHSETGSDQDFNWFSELTHKV